MAGTIRSAPSRSQTTARWSCRACRDRVSLCINSFSTPKGGLTARLVDVGDGRPGGPLREPRRERRRGARRCGCRPPLAARRQGSRRRGRDLDPRRALHPPVRSEALHVARPAGCISVGVGSVRRRGEGLRLQSELARRLAHARAPQERTGPAQGRHRVHVLRRPNRSLIAEIPGSVKPDERIVLAGARPGAWRQRRRERMRDAARGGGRAGGNRCGPRPAAAGPDASPSSGSTRSAAAGSG